MILMVFDSYVVKIGSADAVDSLPADIRAENETPPQALPPATPPITREVKYVGRTQHAVARAWQDRHSLDPLKRSLVFEKQAVGLTKAQARGLEQILFEQHGGFKLLLNQILPLNPNHRLAAFYRAAGTEIWRTL